MTNTLKVERAIWIYSGRLPKKWGITANHKLHRNE